MTNLKEEVFNCLKEVGLMPSYDQDGDIRFKYNLDTYYVLFTKDDERLFRIALYNIYRVNAENREAVLSACNKVNGMVYVAKTFINTNNRVCIIVQQIIDSSPVFAEFIPRTLRCIARARIRFENEMLD